MTRSLLVTTLILFATVNNAQINIGSDQNPKGSSATEWKDGQLEALHASTTLAFLRPSEADQVEAVQAKLDSFWTISKIKVYTIDKVKQAMEENSDQPLSFLALSSRKITGDAGTYYHVLLDLFMFDGKDKKGNDVVIYYSKVAIHPNGDAFRAGVKQLEGGSMEKLYTEPGLINFSPGLLVNYARYINSMITSKTLVCLYKSKTDKKALRALKENTLFILDNVTQDFHVMARSESPMKEPSTLLKKYPYKTAFISKEDLSKKLMEEVEPFYYLVYVRSTMDKFVAVYKSDSGEQIYADYDAKMMGSQNFDAGDLGKIASALENGK